MYKVFPGVVDKLCTSRGPCKDVDLAHRGNLRTHAPGLKNGGGYGGRAGQRREFPAGSTPIAHLKALAEIFKMMTILNCQIVDFLCAQARCHFFSIPIQT